MRPQTLSFFFTILTALTSFSSLATTSCVRTSLFQNDDKQDVEQFSLESLDDPRQYSHFLQKVRDPSGPHIFYILPPRATFSFCQDSGRTFADPYADHFTRNQRANHWTDLCMRAAKDIANENKYFAIEHETSSYFWYITEVLHLLSHKDVFTVNFEDKHFTSRNKDSEGSTRILTNYLPFRNIVPDNLAKDTSNRKAKTQLKSSFDRLPQLRSTIASCIYASLLDPVRTLFEGDSWIRTLQVTTGKRKRKLGTAVKEVYLAWKHRQRRTARQAVASGRQMKRRAFRPILTTETTPGEAVRHCCTTDFPLDSEEPLSALLQDTLDYVFTHQEDLPEERRKIIEFWTTRAEELREKSLTYLDKLPFSNRQILLKGRNIGEFFHVYLFAELIAASGHPDTSLPFEIAEGMNVVGPVAKSHVWEEENVEASKTLEEVMAGAWDYRQNLIKDCKVNSYSDEIYKGTIEERDLGFCEGPMTPEQISEHLGTDSWLPLHRFGIEQKDKVRPIDNAQDNGANATSSRTEKLATSSIDNIVSTIRAWLMKHQEIDLGVWALDEYKAYRQIPIAPEQRRYSVVSVVNPKGDRPHVEFFAMNSHCFGYVNAVYNYNRRPLAMQRILVKLLKVVTDFYYDDRWSVEPMTTIESGITSALDLFQLLGIKIQEDKLQGPSQDFMEKRGITPKDKTAASSREPYQDPELLGVHFDLKRLKVRVLKKRKEKLRNEILGILKVKKLTSGHAAKLKGKLQFVGSSLFGKVGRSFLRPLSERQYESYRDCRLNPALELALDCWLDILDRGMPRPIIPRLPRAADAVWFTDGQSEPGTQPRIGGVLFAQWRETPVYFSCEVPNDILQKWLPRKTQIMLVELLAAVVLQYHFKEELYGKRVLGMIDSECALDALIKGLSKFDDVIELLRIFWKTSLQKRKSHSTPTESLRMRTSETDHLETSSTTPLDVGGRE